MQNDWMAAGIETKAKINKSLDVNARKVVSTAKGKAMADCIKIWKVNEKAGQYDQKGYMHWIKSITDVDDPNYDMLVQINSAVDNSRDWVVLQGMIETLL